MNGIAKASPVSVATGRASRASGEVASPAASRTTRNAAELLAIRNVTNSRCPFRMSAGDSVVSAATR
jgi:hypothetical protein